MAFISGIGAKTVVADIFTWSPEAAACIRQWHEIVLRGESPLSVAERELIAAYTSGLNACKLCYGVHKLVAEQFGINAATFEKLLDDIDAAPLDEKIKPLLRYAETLTKEPYKITQAHADAVFAAGWNEQALHDAINVICMFNFMNRIVLGHGGTEGDITPHFKTSADQLSQRGYFPPSPAK